jgi:hypothetical protein
MNTVIAGWLKVIGAGATAVAGVIIAGPVTKQTAIIAVCTFFAAAGSAAAALLQPSPAKAPETK